jgi:hypothetical protein
VACLEEIVVGVRARAPMARILLVDYLTVLTEGSSSNQGKMFSSSELAILLQIQESLAGGHQEASRCPGAELLAASGKSIEHAVGLSEPWVYGLETDPLRVAGSFHPNEARMRAIADLALDLLIF